MKRIILSLTLLLGFQILFGQSSDFQFRKYRDSQRKDQITTRLRWISQDLINKLTNYPGTKLHKTGKVEKLDYKILELWDSAGGKWVNFEKTIFDFDSSGKLLSDLYLVWDIDEWLNDYKTQFTYDGSGRQALINYNLWESTKGIWEDVGKDEITYDGSNNLTSSIYSEWDISKSVWTKITKNDYTYDGNKNMLSDTYLEWDATKSLWVNFDKFEYTYDDNGNLLKDAYFVWNKLGSNWDSKNRFEYTYNSKDNVLTATFQDWIAGNWVYSKKESYSYDAQDRILSMIYTVWDKTKSLWVNNYKNDYTYDAGSNESVMIKSVWIVRDSKWVNSEKEERTYDLTKKLEDVVWPYADDFEDVNFTSKPTRLLTSEWLTGNSTWQNYSRLTYTFAAFGTSGIREFASNNNILIVPNPATGIVNIRVIGSESYEIRLYDNAGRLLTSSIEEGQAKIDVSTLTQGFYLLEFISEGTRLGQKKLIVN